MTVEKTGVFFQISYQQKEFCEQVAQKLDISFSEFIRVAVAEKAGYDFNAEKALNKKLSKAGRPRVYANEAERQAATQVRNAKRDELTRRLLEDHKQQERRRDAANMAKSLERKGISIDI